MNFPLLLKTYEKIKAWENWRLWTAPETIAPAQQIIRNAGLNFI